MANLYSTPPRVAIVAPSILSADFTRMGEECRGVLEAGAEALHLDVMDGHFAPNLTMGPDMCRWIRKEFPEALLDVHLMVTDPGRFIDPFIKAGASHLTFHVEVKEPPELRKLAGLVRTRGASVGLAINPATPADRILPLVPDFDLILVMSVVPGFSGQKFIGDVLAKVRVIKPGLKPSQRLEMDGGIGLENAATVRAAGCDVIVAATAVFDAPPAERRRIIGALSGRS
jgi:ribulose-phosphate 3-epimerase